MESKIGERIFFVISMRKLGSRNSKNSEHRRKRRKHPIFLNRRQRTTPKLPIFTMKMIVVMIKAHKIFRAVLMEGGGVKDGKLCSR